MQTEEKIRILADDSRFDLACACGTRGGPDHRRRGADGLWLYPVSLPSGGQSIMLKTLLSNACVNDCLYCPFRRDRDVPRATLPPDDVARLFMEMTNRHSLHGIFLSSGVMRDPDHTIDRLAAVARLLRKKHQYRGFIHLKIIPGASDAAIEEALSLASAVSLNVETPRRSTFERLSSTKNFDRDILRPMRLISRLTGRGMRFSRVRKTTQFIVGASTESDSDLVRAMFGLYRRLGLDRVYFSAYQRGLGDARLPGENTEIEPKDLLTREHRLYQADWLIRRYRFDEGEIPFEPDGSLSLAIDPKEMWARRHPERFPMDLNRAGKYELLRVPGLGEITVQRILNLRREGTRVRSMEELLRLSRWARKAEAYLKFGY